MDIIDAHVHTPFWDTKKFPEKAKLSGVTFSRQGLLDEMRENRIIHIVSPTTYLPDNNDDLLDKDRLGELKGLPITNLLGINPGTLVPQSLREAKQLLVSKAIGGFKVYLGYYHRGISDDEYLPFFEMAAEHRVPVLIHTGDTLFPTAKLRFSHPLTIDDVAVDFPKTTFVMAHMGNPWTTDAAAVCYKNDNVMMDVSGFVVGKELPASIAERFKQAYAYVENPEKFLFGSDWPLAPMRPYIEYFQRIVPEKDHGLFFNENARRVYDIPR